MLTSVDSRTGNRRPQASRLDGVAVRPLVTPRTVKGFVDGFGGAVVGGIVYWGLSSALGGGISSFPWLTITPIALLFGLFEMHRVR